MEGNWVMARLSSAVGTRSGIVATRMGSFEWLPPDFCFFAGTVLLHRLCYAVRKPAALTRTPALRSLPSDFRAASQTNLFYLYLLSVGILF